MRYTPCSVPTLNWCCFSLAVPTSVISCSGFAGRRILNFPASDLNSISPSPVCLLLPHHCRGVQQYDGNGASLDTRGAIVWTRCDLQADANGSSNQRESDILRCASQPCYSNQLSRLVASTLRAVADSFSAAPAGTKAVSQVIGPLRWKMEYLERIGSLAPFILVGRPDGLWWD